MFYTSALEFLVVLITIMPKSSLSNLDLLCGGVNALQLNHLLFFSQQRANAQDPPLFSVFFLARSSSCCL